MSRSVDDIFRDLEGGTWMYFEGSQIHEDVETLKAEFERLRADAERRVAELEAENARLREDADAWRSRFLSQLEQEAAARRGESGE